MSEESTTTEAKALATEKAAAAKRARASQQAARVILADGLSELAKQCRKFVAAQGEGAEEATAQLVLDLTAVAESALAK